MAPLNHDTEGLYILVGQEDHVKAVIPVRDMRNREDVPR